MWIDDCIVAESHESLCLKVWVPESTFVVLGRSNKAEEEVNLSFTEDNQIEVLQRRGGGGTVVLYPGCLVISLGIWVNNYYENKFFFQAINASVIEGLETFFGTSGRLAQNGISDIVSVDQRKVAGTSMFRSRGYLLYQASILSQLDLELVSQCLQHPSKEPDYRAKRSHADFLTDLKAVFGRPFESKELGLFLEDHLIESLRKNLANFLVDPHPEHMDSLKKRFETSMNSI